MIGGVTHWLIVAPLSASQRLTVFGAGLVTPILWRAVNEYGEVLDVLLREHRDTGAAKRFFRRLIDDQELPERIVTDTPYGAQVGSGVTVQRSGRRWS